MAKSELLKDLVKDKVDLENVLSRLKVILYDLNDEYLIRWVDGELGGFKDKNDDLLPSYRILKGTPIGTFLVNFNQQYKNAQVPLRVLIEDDEELIDSILTMRVQDSVPTIQRFINTDDGTQFVKHIQTEFCHQISVERLQLASMYVNYPKNHISDILSQIKSKLINIIMELEKNFDDIDELDIEEQVESDGSKKETVVNNIQSIVFDESIKVGDGNRFSKSKLGHLLRGDKK